MTPAEHMTLVSIGSVYTSDEFMELLRSGIDEGALSQVERVYALLHGCGNVRPRALLEGPVEAIRALAPLLDGACCIVGLE